MAAHRRGSRDPAGAGDRPLRAVVCDAIRDQIVSGVHRPGERLVEERLADELGVSRNPVREALRALEVEGYVELIPRRGAIVAGLSPAVVAEILEVRGALEALGARLAARRATPAEVRRLERLLDRSAQVVARGDLRRLPDLNTRFHQLLLDIGGNHLLAETMAPLRGRTQWIFAQTVGERARQSLAEHRELAAAVAAGDEERAAALAAAHVAVAHDSYRARTDPGVGT
jgi:DNA-binding GntR family transcriptional regulator